MAKPRRNSRTSLAARRPVESLIYVVRGQKVMLDSDLAALYQVTTGNLNLAVRRNKTRFPADFMFALSKLESQSLILQSAIPNAGRGGRRTPPNVFTELGVAMLASVLNSERAVQMNIVIMRAFVRLREIVANNRRTLASISSSVGRSASPR